MMLPAGEVRIYLSCGVTDMRRGFHSLAAQVQTTLNHDPYSGALYIFRGRRGDLIKVLFWDRQGMLFSPGICWSGLRMNRSGSEVHALQMNS